MLRIRLDYGNETGLVLAVALVILVVLGVMGSAAVIMTRGDLKISGNYKNSETAFYVAEAGIEHAREVLRAMNAASVDKNSLSDELASVTGSNGVLDGNVSGSDDVPLINAVPLGNDSYTVYLTNDSVDGSLNQTDSNKTVVLTSVATGPLGSQATIESTVKTFDLFRPPGAITLLGNGATFTGNKSGSKNMHGDDQCGTEPPKPVVAISHLADVAGVKSAINSSKPETYHTKDSGGNPVTAVTNPDDIAKVIPQSTVDSITSTYGTNLLDAVDLNDFVTDVKQLADTVAPGGTAATDVYVGAPGDTRVVVVDGDFSLNANGAGILVVTGELTLQGNINYDGLILVFGTGSIKRAGGGENIIRGGIIVADTRGPDGIPGTSDDALGPPMMDTSGGGESIIIYCSKVIDDMLAGIPPRPISFKHFF
ncbi:MAG: pilus assembly PilX N-terminal domain-containing protein [Deltaproteobacteria bacterium]|nr:pilus assembly PilX N-terminal domain-containing protein [Deltaproteobacteria bacterium]